MDFKKYISVGKVLGVILLAVLVVGSGFYSRSGKSVQNQSPTIEQIMEIDFNGEIIYVPLKAIRYTPLNELDEVSKLYLTFPYPEKIINQAGPENALMEVSKGPGSLNIPYASWASNRDMSIPFWEQYGLTGFMSENLSGVREIYITYEGQLVTNTIVCLPPETPREICYHYYPYKIFKVKNEFLKENLAIWKDLQQAVNEFLDTTLQPPEESSKQL